MGSIHKSSISYKFLISLLTKHDVNLTLGWQDTSLYILAALQDPLSDKFESHYLKTILIFVNYLTLKAPITTADDKFCNIYPNFRKKKCVTFHENRLLMKYHSLFVIFEKAAKFQIVVCCKT